jgi:hypothetical protein
MPGGQVTLAPLAPLSKRDQAALESDAADVSRFLGTRPPARA